MCGEHKQKTGWQGRDADKDSHRRHDHPQADQPDMWLVDNTDAPGAVLRGHGM